MKFLSPDFSLLVFQKKTPIALFSFSFPDSSIRNAPNREENPK